MALCRSNLVPQFLSQSLKTGLEMTIPASCEVELLFHENGIIKKEFFLIVGRYVYELLKFGLNCIRLLSPPQYNFTILSNGPLLFLPLLNLVAI